MAHTEQVNINGILTTARVFDQPAQAIDDAVSRALPGGAIDQRVSMLCNPNLLDNWYFGNPVNQRGQTSYTGAGYGIDRWASNGNDSVTAVTNNGIEFYTPSIYFDLMQKIESPLRLNNQVLTFSVLFSEPPTSGGAIRITTDSTNHQIGLSTTHLLQSITATVNDIQSLLQVSIQCGTAGGRLKIKAAKLELGSHQTLAHQDADGNWVLNEIPDYGDQLARCQRTLIPIAQYDRYRASYMLPNSIDFIIPVTNTMRAFPVLIGNGLGIYTITGEPITGFTFNTAIKGFGDIMVRAVKENHGLPDATLYVNNTVLLSADL